MHCPKTQEDRKKATKYYISFFQSSLIGTGVLGHHPVRIQRESLPSPSFRIGLERDICLTSLRLSLCGAREFLRSPKLQWYLVGNPDSARLT